LSHPKSKDYKKKRNLIIFSSLTAFLLIFTAFQHYIIVGSLESMGQRGVFLLVANLNILLLMIVVVLLLRNVIKLYFERRRRVFGSALKTKLVIAFVSFSIIPTVLLFFYASGTIKRAFEAWFSPGMDLSRANISFVQAVDEDYVKRASHFANIIKDEVEKRGPNDIRNISAFFYRKLVEYDLNYLKYFSGKNLVASVYREGLHPSTFDDGISDGDMDRLYSGEIPFYSDVKYGAQNFVLYALPLFKRSGLLVMNYPLSEKIGENKVFLRKSIEGYKQLKLTEKENITIYTVLIGIFTLLIIFSATWLGTYIAKSITVPMGKMADGIKAVSSGDLSVTVESGFTDEFTMLADSFNMMTLELRNSNEEIKRVQENLRKTNIELEGRRMYMATVLQNITTGVLSIDEGGRITTFNRSLR